MCVRVHPQVLREGPCQWIHPFSSVARTQSGQPTPAPSTRGDTKWHSISTSGNCHAQEPVRRHPLVIMGICLTPGCQIIVRGKMHWLSLVGNCQGPAGEPENCQVSGTGEPVSFKSVDFLCKEMQKLQENGGYQFFFLLNGSTHLRQCIRRMLQKAHIETQNAISILYA